ncbi:hypothetical protein ACFQ2B_07135 [Streptomyces stramineus]
MMDVGLISSLHLNHGGMSLHTGPGDPMPMQTFVPVGLLSLKAAADSAGIPAAIDVVEVNRLLVDGTIPNTDALYDDIAASVLAAGDDLVGLMTDADSSPTPCSSDRPSNGARRTPWSVSADPPSHR